MMPRPMKPTVVNILTSFAESRESQPLAAAVPVYDFVRDDSVSTRLLDGAGFRN